MLALVLMVGVVIDDAIVVLENIFRFIEEKRMHAARSGQGGDEGYWPGGAGDYAFTGRDLSARVVHVVDLRPLPLSVWHYRGRRDHGEFAGVFHADADDELAADSGERRRVVTDTPASRRGFYRWIDGGYTLDAGVCDAASPGSCRSVVAVIFSSIPLYRSVKQEFIPTQR